MTDLRAVTEQAAQAAEILLREAKPERGALCVIGCCTSEVGGHQIGSASSEEIAAALWAGLMPPLEAAGVFLAVQGCEHINRALCVSRACARQYGLPEVMVSAGQIGLQMALDPHELARAAGAGFFPLTRRN